MGARTLRQFIESRSTHLPIEKRHRAVGELGAILSLQSTLS
jgi:hypothetical protein